MKRRQKLGKHQDNRGRFQMPAWMECTWRRIPCQKDTCPICGRIKRDRLRHLQAGEDPDAPAAMLEDVGEHFREALDMIRQDAEQRGIVITNLENVAEPPKPEAFPLYRMVAAWRMGVMKLADRAQQSDSSWLSTEAAADLFWYVHTLAAKTYRQLCNRWHLENGDDYGGDDYKYTAHVLQTCLKILKKSLKKLSSPSSSQKDALTVSLARIAALEKQILDI